MVSHEIDSGEVFSGTKAKIGQGLNFSNVSSVFSCNSGCNPVGLGWR